MTPALAMAIALLAATLFIAAAVSRPVLYFTLGVLLTSALALVGVNQL